MAGIPNVQGKSLSNGIVLVEACNVQEDKE